jgi:hypothetical protein
VWAERAQAAWSAIARDALGATRRGVRLLDGPGGRRADLWPFVHVLWAGAEVQGLGRPAPIDDLLTALNPFRSGEAYAASPGGRRYYDDNAWLGLAMLRVGQVTSEPVWGGRAAELARWIEHGEDPDGGVRWAEGLASRNTCSTAAAAWLVLAAGTADGKERAARWLAWLDETLGRPDGLYDDRIEHGRVQPDVWTYNQGAVLAASARIGRPHDGLRAAILEHWPPERLWAEPPAFATIAYRALMGDRRRVVSIHRATRGRCARPGHGVVHPRRRRLLRRAPDDRPSGRRADVRVAGHGLNAGQGRRSPTTGVV